MTLILPLTDALAALPTHADRLAHAEQTASLTGAFPWGLADPDDPTQRPDVSAALLIAHRRRQEAGLPPLADLMGEWRENGRLTIRESIGPTVTMAWVGSVEWMVCRFGGAPITGKDPANGRRDADAVLLDLGFALLDGDVIRVTCGHTLTA